MPHTSPERYRQLFEYEKATHLKVFQSLTDAFESAGRSDQLQKAVHLMAHIILGRHLWHYRLGGTKVAPSFDRQRVSFEDLKSDLEEMHIAWSRYMENLSDAEVSRVFDYRTTEGVPYRVSVEDVLTQLYGHSLHHSGQIAYLLRQSGCTPPEMDFIFYARQPI